MFGRKRFERHQRSASVPRDPIAAKLSRVARIGIPAIHTIGETRFSDIPIVCGSVAHTSARRLFGDLPRSWHALSSAELAYVICASLAHNLRPYGRGCPSTKLVDMVAAASLDCSNYGLVTYYLAQFV